MVNDGKKKMLKRKLQVNGLHYRGMEFLLNKVDWTGLREHGPVHPACMAYEDQTSANWLQHPGCVCGPWRSLRNPGMVEISLHLETAPQVCSCGLSPTPDVSPHKHVSKSTFSGIPIFSTGGL